MQREIKFRAWAIDAKVMHPMWNVVSDEDGKYILMQYTGIKDKNKFEIYEGDIVVAGGYFAEIKWNTEEAKFDFWEPETDEYEGQWHDDLTSLGSENIKVIGNIYQNPDLLK